MDKGSEYQAQWELDDKSYRAAIIILAHFIPGSERDMILSDSPKLDYKTEQEAFKAGQENFKRIQTEGTEDLRMGRIIQVGLRYLRTMAPEDIRERAEKYNLPKDGMHFLIKIARQQQEQDLQKFF